MGASLVQTAAGALVVGQRLLEQTLRLVRLRGRHGAPVGDCGERPWSAGGLGEAGELVGPPAGKVGFIGSYRCVDALDSGHPGQDRESEPAQVVKGPEVVPRTGCVDPLGPAGEVVYRVGQDAQRVRRYDFVEVAQSAVVVVSVLQCREQGQPCRRRGGHRALTDALPERECLLGVTAHSGKVPGDEMAEAQPLEGVDHRRDSTTVPGSRECERVETLLGVVITQLQSGVAEVPQDRDVVDFLAARKCRVEGGNRAGPILLGGRRHGEQHLLEAPGSRGVVRCGLNGDVAGWEGGAAVDGVGAHDGGGDRCLQGT
jgi:hypothetical protein